MIRCIPFFFLLALTIFPATPVAAEKTDATDILPPLTLTIPDNEGYRTYLGLKGKPGDNFELVEIDADVLLIQFFSMYCPFCQEEAPLINELFQTLVDFSSEDFSVKMIGIGTNNSDFEVSHYRATFDIEFPLFSDLDMHNYAALDGKGTPSFIACQKNERAECKIILRQSGGFNTVDEFLKKLLQKSGYR